MRMTRAQPHFSPRAISSHALWCLPLVTELASTTLVGISSPGAGMRNGNETNAQMKCMMKMEMSKRETTEYVRVVRKVATYAAATAVYMYRPTGR